MKYWRMRMRDGWHGKDMFKQCRPEGVAAIQYGPVDDIDLSKFHEDNPPPEWKGLKSAQSGYLKKVAWNIRGGDTIYVVESNPSRIVGVGRVKGAEGKQAYHFRANTPIVDEHGHRWQHQIDVEWTEFYKPGIQYQKPWATQCTVLDLKPPEITKIKQLIAGNSKKNYSISDSKSARQTGFVEDDNEDEIHLRQLEESAYTRYTTEALKIIDRKHVKLCNTFTDWIYSTRGIKCSVERRNIDATFRMGKQSVLVEFKVAYHSDPKPAIREALGQILEYNHYPDRRTHDQWILVLDCMPTETDQIFLRTLRNYGIPLSFGWQTSKGFQFSKESPLFREVANGS
jgi:hypothetical protein